VESKTVSTKDREKYDEELTQTKQGIQILSVSFSLMNSFI
jgi:hypothetical protein